MNPPIFITARFRTGSTLLWNIFRQIPGVVAFYEPLHEQLPQLIECNPPPQPTHDFVDTYFNEYPPAAELAQHHRPEFGLCRLHLEAGKAYPQLKSYIQYLLDSVGGDKTPVLQFNRVDFRLSWLRANFPQARLIHLYRAPRDQWLSAITGDPNYQDEDTESDPYLQTTWARDLYQQFPFLAGPFIRHPYQQHYYLWKLSYLAGRRLADLSIAYEELLTASEDTLKRLLDLAGLDTSANLKRSRVVIVSKPIDKWLRYRPENWFTSLEQDCETTLTELGLNDYFGRKSLAEIIAASPPYQTWLVDPCLIEWARRSDQLAITRLKNEAFAKETVIQLKEAEIQTLAAMVRQQTDELNAKEEVIRQMLTFRYLSPGYWFFQGRQLAARYLKSVL